MRPQCVKAMPDRRAQRLMIHSRTENFQVREEQDPVSAFFPCLTLGLLRGQEYCWGDGEFPSWCMFAMGFILCYFGSPPVSAVNWKRLGVSWGPVYCLSALWKHVWDQNFQERNLDAWRSPGEERAQHWIFFFKAWPGQDPFHLAGLFSSLVPSKQGRHSWQLSVDQPAPWHCTDQAGWRFWCTKVP